MFRDDNKDGLTAQVILRKVNEVLSVYGIDESNKWDEIVKSFRQHDVYYLSSYVKAFRLHGDGEPQLLYFDNGKTRAINVVMKRDIAECEHFASELEPGQWYDFSTPYGYGGFLFEGDNVEELATVYTEYCERNRIVSELVRFHPLLGNARVVSGMYDVTELGKTVHIDLTSPSLIWSNFTSKNRNVIRKATKLGVKVYWGRSPQLFHQFQEMYNQTMDVLGAVPYYYFERDFYESILSDLGHNSLIFYATYQERTIAMALILMCSERMHYHLSCSEKDYRQYAATNLLLYEAALWGHENGFKTLHLGGGLGGRSDSLYQFKKSFNHQSENTFAIGKKCFNEETYNWLVGMRKKKGLDLTSSFFPLYRA